MINSGLRLFERLELSRKSKAQYFLFIPSFSILWDFIGECFLPPHPLLEASCQPNIVGLVWQASVKFQIHFSLLQKKNQIKNILTFLHFLHITSITFYYYSNKKTYSKTKLLHFFIKHSQILYHINHFLLLFKQIFHYTITYQTPPLAPRYLQLTTI
jgi:hypothetical protein